MDSILITQCLQNDFVKPLAKGEALPNLLHIGYEESKRLVGSDADVGPINRFMDWANAQSKEQSNESLSIIHIRDWHDETAENQKNHLDQFGPHCIQGTPGAEFIFSCNDSSAKIVNSTTLNDFEETELQSLLNAAISGKSKKLRVGIVGVWTEAKVLFLAYELTTRYPNFEVAVCSALTASSSRSQHFLALQQLSRIVGVKVIDSVGEFVQFLGGQYNGSQHVVLNKQLQINADGDINLGEESENLVRYLFRDCQKIDLKVLDGGFSGNLVAGVKSIDMLGQEQTPHVIKIGPRDLMAKERTSFEQIESVLGNSAPAIAEYLDSESKGAIKYRYASMGGGKTRTLQDAFQKLEAPEKIKKHLDILFDDQLGKFYRAAVSEKIDLLEYYCFSSQWAESVKEKMQELLGDAVGEGDIVFPGGKSAPNLYHFYKDTLDSLPPMVGDYPVSFVHGDLNGANVIIDERDNVWLIDFFHTHRGHVLKDFSKLENDLLYIYTPIESEQELMLAYSFSDFLINQNNPFDLSDELPQEFKNTQFQHAYNFVRTIRGKIPKEIRQNVNNARLQWLVPQLRYAVHTIGFDEPNTYQRIWAMYSSSLISSLLKAA